MEKHEITQEDVERMEAGLPSWREQFWAAFFKEFARIANEDLIK